MDDEEGNWKELHNVMNRAQGTLEALAALRAIPALHTNQAKDDLWTALQERDRVLLALRTELLTSVNQRLGDAKKSELSDPESFSRFIGLPVKPDYFHAFLRDSHYRELVKKALKNTTLVPAVKRAYLAFSNLLHTSTRQRVQEQLPGYFFGQPIPGVYGNGKTSFYHVLEGSTVRFGKVGRLETVRQEFENAEKVHSKFKALTVIKMSVFVTLEEKDKTSERGVCIMPLHSLSVKDVLLSVHPLDALLPPADPPLPSATPTRPFQHLTLAYNFVLCSLATLEAFRRNGYCYGDLKPSNALLSTDSNVIVSMDFGSATEYGQRLKEATDAYTLGLAEDVPASLHFDLTCLLASAFEVIVGRPPISETVASIREYKMDGAAQPLFNALVKAVEARYSNTADLEPLAREISALATSASVQGLVHIGTIWPRPLTSAT